MKGSSRPLGEDKHRLNRPIETKAGKLHQQYGRHRGESIRHREDSGTDRTEIVSSGIAGWALRPIIIGRRSRDQGDQATFGALSAGRVKVTKGQAEIDDQREHREP
nr:hypothetical protein [Bradyrhizobium erythrophlei]